MTDRVSESLDTVRDSLRAVYTDCAQELELLTEIDPDMVAEITRSLDSVQRQLQIASLNTRISSLETELVVKQFTTG